MNGLEIICPDCGYCYMDSIEYKKHRIAHKFALLDEKFMKENFA